MIKLTKRLEAIKNRITPGGSVVDVGTDHGMLPVYLAVNGLASVIAATDINPEPLARGRELAAEHGVADRISFVLTDGLKGTEPVFDTVVIAGMGGETMIGILEAAPWVRENRVRLILQPQSKFAELTLWLTRNGYAFYDGELVHERGKYYVVLEASASDSPMDRFFILRMLNKKRDPLLPEYLDQLIRIQKSVVNGVEKSENREQLLKETDALEALLQMREETEKWHR